MRPAWMSPILICAAFMLVAYHILESFRNIFRHWLESYGKFAYLFGYFFSFSRPKKLLDIFLCDLNILFGFFVSESVFRIVIKKEPALELFEFFFNLLFNILIIITSIFCIFVDMRIYHIERSFSRRKPCHVTPVGVIVLSRHQEWRGKTQP